MHHICGAFALGGLLRWDTCCPWSGSRKEIHVSGPSKSLEVVLNLICQVLHDALASHGVNTRAISNTLQKVRDRTGCEGLAFLTKSLPKLGKCLDEALSTNKPLTRSMHGWKAMRGSELPLFCGELFSGVFDKFGQVLPSPDAKCVRSLRTILRLFYKYKTPYCSAQEQVVVDQFISADRSLEDSDRSIDTISRRLDLTYALNKRAYLRRIRNPVEDLHLVLRDARFLLSDLFAHYDPLDIVPRHGPGTVSTKERLRDKFRWTNVSSKLTDLWPLDAYFYASNGHVCDAYKDFASLSSATLPARVILVPKDSRGPRLISCEPVDFQWIQQGLQKSLYDLVEHHWLTKFNVFFTNQEPNRFGALLGSSNGRYVTLDLKEASDRVSLKLVTELFPEHVKRALVAARTEQTRLPDGSLMNLRKFAPMGSAICFPILALTIWSILSAGAPDLDTRESILVYGDDVIVPSSFAASAITLLESFGLLVNRSKSCLSGFFRESCGMDAFQGVCVTPVRISALWQESPHPDAYDSWISYANSFFERSWFRSYNYIVEELEHIYGSIPTRDMGLTCPSLAGPTNLRWFKTRVNSALQKVEYRVRVTESLKERYIDTGWIELLRYFTEAARPNPFSPTRVSSDPSGSGRDPVSVYTIRRRNKFRFAWR
jgi:hypothetical protein